MPTPALPFSALLPGDPIQTVASRLTDFVFRSGTVGDIRTRAGVFDKTGSIIDMLPDLAATAAAFIEVSGGVQVTQVFNPLTPLPTPDVVGPALEQAATTIGTVLGLEPADSEFPWLRERVQDLGLAIGDRPNLVVIHAEAKTLSPPASTVHLFLIAMPTIGRFAFLRPRDGQVFRRRSPAVTPPASLASDILISGANLSSAPLAANDSLVTLTKRIALEAAAKETSAGVVAASGVLSGTIDVNTVKDALESAVFRAYASELTAASAPVPSNPQVDVSSSKGTAGIGFFLRVIAAGLGYDVRAPNNYGRLTKNLIDICNSIGAPKDIMSFDAMLSGVETIGLVPWVRGDVHLYCLTNQKNGRYAVIYVSQGSHTKPLQ